MPEETVKCEFMTVTQVAKTPGKRRTFVDSIIASGVDNQNGRRNNDKWQSYQNGAKPKQQGQRNDLTCDIKSQVPTDRRKAQRDREFREACDAIEETEGETVHLFSCVAFVMERRPYLL